jgi:hypothetical protein
LQLKDGALQKKFTLLRLIMGDAKKREVLGIWCREKSILMKQMLCSQQRGVCLCVWGRGGQRDPERERKCENSPCSPSWLGIFLPPTSISQVLRLQAIQLCLAYFLIFHFLFFLRRKQKFTGWHLKGKKIAGS